MISRYTQLSPDLSDGVQYHSTSPKLETCNCLSSILGPRILQGGALVHCLGSINIQDRGLKWSG